MQNTNIETLFNYKRKVYKQNVVGLCIITYKLYK